MKPEDRDCLLVLLLFAVATVVWTSLALASPCGEYAPDPQVCERVMEEHVARPVREDVRSGRRSPWTGTEVHGSHSALEGREEAIDFDAALAQAIRENNARKALRASRRHVPTTSTWAYLQRRWSAQVPSVPQRVPGPYGYKGAYQIGRMLREVAETMRMR